MRHFKRKFTKSISLCYVSKATVEEHFNHARISKSTGFMEWVVSKLVTGEHLLSDDPRILRVIVLLEHDKPNNFILVVFNSNHERRSLIWLITHEW